jgi:hypothetical protein
MDLSVTRRLALVVFSCSCLIAPGFASEAPAANPAPQAARTPTIGGALPVPLPLLPPDNWWNVDISGWPLDPGSASYINFIGPNRGLHPDFGGEVDPGSTEIYGFPYVVVGGSQPKKAVGFYYGDESDGVDHGTGQSYPFYPIPDEAITQPHWIEGGWAGNDPAAYGDRHMLIVDRDNNLLYELYDLSWNGSSWTGGSGAFFDLKTNNRRPEGWTSADAAGLAILPGLVRYDEVLGPDEIDHAFRFTVRASNGHVYPASHSAGSTALALPMGARLRLKAATVISSFPAEIQKIFRAMKKYGLIVADNGSDMYISGTFDTRWNNDVLNPAFAALHASDFEVVTLGFNPSPAPSVSAVSPAAGTTAGGTGIVVSGTGFKRGATVQLGGTAATGVSVDRSTRVQALTPAHAAGAVTVTVTNPDAQSGSAASAFTYCSTAPAAPTISSAWWVPVDATAVPASVPLVAGRSWVWSLAGGTLKTGQGTNAVTLDAGPPGTTMALRVSEVPGDACASAAAERGIQVDFLDVPPSHGFHDFVDKLALRRITGGCGNGGYCPDQSVTRAQMAVFLLAAKHGSSYQPPPAVGIFADVPVNDPFARWIEQLYNDGVTAGCGSNPRRYCPGNAVTRAQMAVFLLASKYGSGYVPPPATGLFADVPVNDPFAPWIEELYNEGVTGGCGASPRRYCPGDPNTRGQMAVFLTATFGL